MPLANEKLGKAYKLCSIKEIESLFKTGKKIYKFPFSCQVKLSDEQKTPPFQIVISVPKRGYKKAVDRNHLKRLIREAVRKNKLILETFLVEKNKGMSLFLIYTHKEKLTFQEIQDKTRLFFIHLREELEHEENNL